MLVQIGNSEDVLVLATSELVTEDDMVCIMAGADAMGVLSTTSVATYVEETLVVSTEDLGVSTALGVDSGTTVGDASVVGVDVVASTAVCVDSVAIADARWVVDVLVTVTVEVASAVVAMIMAAAVTAPKISTSDIGCPRSSQPACIGARKAEPTLSSPSVQVDAMHCSMVSSRPLVAATQMFLWLSSPSVVYPACWMQSRTQAEKAKVTSSSCPST